MEDYVIISSLDGKILNNIKKINPNISTQLNMLSKDDFTNAVSNKIIFDSILIGGVDSNNLTDRDVAIYRQLKLKLLLIQLQRMLLLKKLLKQELMGFY